MWLSEGGGAHPAGHKHKCGGDAECYARSQRCHECSSTELPLSPAVAQRCCFEARRLGVKSSIRLLADEVGSLVPDDAAARMHHPPTANAHMLPCWTRGQPQRLRMIRLGVAAAHWSRKRIGRSRVPPFRQIGCCALVRHGFLPIASCRRRRHSGLKRCAVGAIGPKCHECCSYCWRSSPRRAEEVKDAFDPIHQLGRVNGARSATRKLGAAGGRSRTLPSL